LIQVLSVFDREKNFVIKVQVKLRLSYQDVERTFPKRKPFERAFDLEEKE
jgi:hypothetical protein